MSSPGLPFEETRDPTEEQPVWHPAQEWPDEADTTTESDYHPSQSRSEEDESMTNEDDDMTPGPSRGHSNDTEEGPTPEGNEQLNLSGIHIELDEAGGYIEYVSGDGLDIDVDDMLVIGETDDPRIERSEIFQLLATTGLREMLYPNGWPHGTERDEFGEVEDYDEEVLSHLIGRRAGRRGKPKFVWPKVPSDAGTKLMASGHFGTNPCYVDRIKKRKEVFATSLMRRELGIDPHGVRKQASQSICQSMIPGSQADKIIHYDSRSYCGQFSDDGDFFFCCDQDFKVRMYDTSNPYEWKYYKTVEYPFGQWTITDASLSPDNRYLVYSSLRSAAYLAPTDPDDDSGPHDLDFSLLPGQARRNAWDLSRSRFGIWSLRFSGDGREVVAGTSENSVIVLDLETRTPVLTRRNRHQADVNAVCFGDSSSPHILYSGSDDTTLRVWDRRSMADGREAGMFMGHTEGLTYVDSKGDGRYVLSNSKDQTMKLWDLRNMMSASAADKIDPNTYSTNFDYRFQDYPEFKRQPHPSDHSIVTFRGHSVLKTLIRCHFSPPGSTNSRYVYTGSEDGKVYVYNIDATLAGTIDVKSATMNSRPRGPDTLSNMWEMGGDMKWRTCVRDASWHPSVPMVAATSWNGWGLSSGTCTAHSWNDGADDDEGDPPIGRSYDHKLRSLPEFNHYQDNPPPSRVHRRTRRPLRSRPVARLDIDENEEDETGW